MIQRFIEWVKRLFSRSPKATSEAVSAQEAATKYEDTTKTNITAIFANKLTNIVKAQSTVSVTGPDGESNKRSEFINEAIQNIWKKSRKITVQTFGKGGKLIIPFVENGKPRFSIIDQHRMVINEMADDRITSATIVADMISRETKKYYRLADYSVENNVHRIANRAVDESGTSVDMMLFPEWKGIAEEIAVSNVDRLLFSFLRCPVDNRVDRDMYGVEITYGCGDVIRAIAKHTAIIEREYDMSRTILGLDRSLWGRKKSTLKDEDGNAIPFGQAIEDVQATVQDSKFPFIPVDTLDSEQPWLLFSPTIRDEAQYRRQDELFALMEKAVGTSRGILTERTSIGATATEIRAGQYDTFCIVDAMRQEWDSALDDLAYAYDVLAEYFGITPAGARGAYTVNIDWDYSMYESSAETFQQLSELQSRRGTSLARLNQWVEGGTLEEAQARVDEAKKIDGESMVSMLGGG